MLFWLGLVGMQLGPVLDARAFTCDSIDDIRLDAEQAQLIKTFKAKEDLAHVAKLLIAIGPALDCITGSNPTDCPFSVATADWDRMATAPGDLDKIVAAANSEDIELYLLGHQSLKPNVRSFFECLDKYYREIKSQ